jgi:hypothetical protein
MVKLKDRSVALLPVGVLWYQGEGVSVCGLDHGVGAIPGHCFTVCLPVTVTELELWLVQLITTNETLAVYFSTISRWYGIFVS